MDENQVEPRRTRPRLGLIAAATVLGAGLGVAILYGTGGFARNVDPACRASAETAAAIRPLAKGEVAALTPAEAPVRVADLAFKTPDGAPTTLEAWKGRVVLLNLWATWCAPCRKEMPDLDKLQATLGGPGFQVVAVNVDQRNLDRARRFLTEVGAERLGFYGDETLAIFNTLKARGRAFGMPTTMLVGPDGCEIGTMHGPAAWASEDALALIRGTLEKVAPGRTS